VKNKKTLGTLILAAGQGKRMKSTLPKVLHKILNRPLLQWVLDATVLDKKNVFCVVSKDNREALQKTLPEPVVLCVQKNLRGTADAVKSALPALKKRKIETVLIAPGDMPLLRKETIEKLLRVHLQKKHQLTLLTGFLETPFGYGRIVRDARGAMQAIVEQKDLTPDQEQIQEINTGVYLFDLKLLEHCLSKIGTQNAQKEFYLTDSVALIYEKQKKSKSVMGSYCLGYTDECKGVNSRQELTQAMAPLRSRKLETLMNQGVTIVDPASTFIDTAVKIGQDTVIHPFTVITGAVSIGENCEIGPFTHLHEGVFLDHHVVVGNFVEIKRSTLGQGTKAKHLSYLGDASLGKKVNIGAGTITANYDGKNKHPTVLGDSCRTGSNSVIIAPNTLGDHVVIGAGSVVPANRNFPSGTLAYGVPAKIAKFSKH
jgi:bifunctional UDP-N-acetylglucosamine pyrophosphorylase/glucosamine-1-phosphate N-acetyltransferase